MQHVRSHVQHVRSHVQHVRSHVQHVRSHVQHVRSHVHVRSQSFSLQLVLFCAIYKMYVSFCWNNGYILISALEFYCPSKDTPKIEWTDDPFALRLEL